MPHHLGHLADPGGGGRGGEITRQLGHLGALFVRVGEGGRERVRLVIR